MNKNQDVLTLDILLPTRHFGWFSRWPPSKNDKLHVEYNRTLKTSNLLIFMSKTCMYECLESISDVNLSQLGL